MIVLSLKHSPLRVQPWDWTFTPHIIIPSANQVSTFADTNIPVCGRSLLLSSTYLFAR